MADGTVEICDDLSRVGVHFGNSVIVKSADRWIMTCEMVIEQIKELRAWVNSTKEDKKEA